jgi:hypothetical protein
MELLLRPDEVAYPDGLSISVDGFKGDIGGDPASQVFIELYKGKLRVHVWDGAEDPAVTTEIERSQPRRAGNKRIRQCHRAKRLRTNL